MEITTFNKFTLIPIGNIRFSFAKKARKSKHYTNVLIREMNIMHNTSRNITPETEKALLKMMKKAKSDLLTDGHDFFTTTGTNLTQIDHPSFAAIKEQHNDDIRKLLYGENA